MAAEPYGYWTFNNKNGLSGLEATIELLPDGRVIEHPDPVNPAVLHEEFIVNALKTSLIARAQFGILFPALLPEEQDRLLGIFVERPFLLKNMANSQAYYDRIQQQNIRSSVRIPKGSTVGGASTTSSTGTQAIGPFSPGSSS